MRPHGSARPTLPLWLAGVLTAVVLGFGALTVYENYNNALREGEARAVSSAHVVAAHMEWMMEASDLALRRIEAAISGRPIDSSTELILDLERAVGELPVGFEYAILDQDGQTRFSSAPDNTLPNHAERAYFKRLKEGEALTFSRLLDNEADRQRQRFPRRCRDHHPERQSRPVLVIYESWTKLNDLGHS